MKKIQIKSLKKKINISDLMISLFRYVFLITMCYVIVYPLLYMVSTSFKTYSEALDPSIVWLPRTVVLENYINAIKGLYLPTSIYRTIFYAKICVQYTKSIHKLTFIGVNALNLNVENGIGV